MSEESETTLRLERLIPMAPEPLFALWTEPAQLVKWWAPEGYQPSVDVLDPRSAGRWRVTMCKADGHEVATSGVFRIVDPPHRLSFTWAWEDASGIRGHETEVTVTFEAAPGGTRLVLVQQRFDAKVARDGHRSGWSAALDRMAIVGS
jgi:glutathione S-transferase